MKISKFQNLNLNAATELTREQMKNVFGGSAGPIKPLCYKCCPSDACSPKIRYCLMVICPD